MNKTSALKWVSVFIVAVALAIFLFLYWQQTSSQQQVVGLSLENSCSAMATNFFMEWKASNNPMAQTLSQNGDTPNYTNHFNKVLQKCLIKIDGGIWHTTSNGPEYENLVQIYDTNSKVSIAFMDAYFHRDRSNGSYNLIPDNVDCSFASGEKCNSTGDFSSRVDTLMSQ